MASKCLEKLLDETLLDREVLCERLQRSIQRATQRTRKAADASNAAQRELRRLQDTHADASASHAPQLQALQERRGKMCETGCALHSEAASSEDKTWISSKTGAQGKSSI
ncbi:unnamed protein product [Durusdinium trenchii]|uniref:Uncharacterized protein n=1 Tax=Durusdinium trenchii TaxID=1381693 RepID=A0ABP0MTS0_9DINO